MAPKHQHEVLAFLGPESVTGQGPGIYVLIQDLGTYPNQWATVQQVGGQGAGGDIQSVERWGWLVGGVRLDASSHEEQQARTVSLGISWGTGGGAFLLPWFLGAGILSALVHSRLQ